MTEERLRDLKWRFEHLGYLSQEEYWELILALESALNKTT